MRTLLKAAALSALATGSVGLAVAGPGQEKPQIQWVKSWEAAVKEASARNVPIFVTFHKDG